MTKTTVIPFRDKKKLYKLPEDLESAFLSVHLHFALSDVVPRHVPDERNYPKCQSTKQHKSSFRLAVCKSFAVKLINDNSDQNCLR